MSTPLPADTPRDHRHDTPGDTLGDALGDTLGNELDERLADADAALSRDYPGERPGRQPVHTVYVPADRFDAGLAATWGRAALEALDAHPAEFRSALATTNGTSTAPTAPPGTDPVDLDALDALETAVRRKLETQPVEDLRIDFEDGYGIRPADEEDTDVDRAVRLLLDATADGSAPPFTGIRFAPFEAPTRRRGLRTLTRFVAGLAEAGPLPDGFVVTLPKVTS
ncbi:MAG: aldolase, partial [Humibacillus sp.]|nr:aldolase [Humibacillus sp.]